jgi:hypothetical protein
VIRERLSHPMFCVLACMSLEDFRCRSFDVLWVMHFECLMSPLWKMMLCHSYCHGYYYYWSSVAAVSLVCSINLLAICSAAQFTVVLVLVGLILLVSTCLHLRPTWTYFYNDIVETSLNMNNPFWYEILRCWIKTSPRKRLDRNRTLRTWKWQKRLYRSWGKQSECRQCAMGRASSCSLHLGRTCWSNK